MRISLLPIRSVLYLLVAVALIGGGVDAGSVTLTRLAVPDDVRVAGQAGAAAVEGRPASAHAATIAFQAASDAGRRQGLRLKAKNFTLYPDGRITLTGSRTAPTLLLQRVPSLRHFTKVRSTTTVTALPFS